MKDYYSYSFGVRVFITIYLTLVMIAGIVGNVLVCAIYVSNKQIRTSINALVVNLAVADILQSFNMVFMIISVHYGRWILGNAMCQINGFATIAFIVTSLINLFLISVNRYIYICMPTKKYLFSKRNVNIAIVISWLYPTIFGILPMIGWSAYFYRPGKLLCTIKFSYNISYSVVICATALLIPFIGICFSYYKIIGTVKLNKKRIQNVAINHANSKSKEESRMAYILGLVILSFMIFYSPSSSANFYESSQGPHYDLPVALDLFGILIAMLNHANNPIIYGFMNKNFRNTFFRWIKIGRDREMLTTGTTKASKRSLRIKFSTRAAIQPREPET